MTRQAIQLGWLPRLMIKQTSSEGFGQIYVRVVNWLLMIVTVGLTIAFGKADNLAAAYGIAVSLTMLMTTVLLFIAMREIWGWACSRPAAPPDSFSSSMAAFFLANLTKVAEGGYVPLLLALVVYMLMWIWHRGRRSRSRRACRIRSFRFPSSWRRSRQTMSRAFRAPRCFLPARARTRPRSWCGTSSTIARCIASCSWLRVSILQVPWVSAKDRIAVTEVAPDFWRAKARFGFMERLDIPEILKQGVAKGCTIDLHDVTYYVRATIASCRATTVPDLGPGARSLHGDGTQRRPRQRRVPPAPRPGRRTRTANLDLISGRFVLRPSLRSAVCLQAEAMSKRSKREYRAPMKIPIDPRGGARR